MKVHRITPWYERGRNYPTWRLQHSQFKWLNQLLTEYSWDYYMTVSFPQKYKWDSARAYAERRVRTIRKFGPTRNAHFATTITEKNGIIHAHMLIGGTRIRDRATERRFSGRLRGQGAYNTIVSAVYDQNPLTRYLAKHSYAFTPTHCGEIDCYHLPGQ